MAQSAAITSRLTAGIVLKSVESMRPQANASRAGGACGYWLPHLMMSCYEVMSWLSFAQIASLAGSIDRRAYSVTWTSAVPSPSTLKR
jgi:hypothetical protein